MLHKNPFIGDGIIAAKILDKLASIGLRSRGIKHRSDLYVMNTCYSQGVSYMLWEICFIGDVDDMEFYTTHMKEIAKVFADEYIDDRSSTKFKLPFKVDAYVTDKTCSECSCYDLCKTWIQMFDYEIEEDAIGAENCAFFKEK